MAAIASTKVAERVPFGQYFLELHRVPVASNGATDEWFVHDFDEVRGVLASATTGVAVGAKPDAQGTGQAEGSTKRAVGVTAVGAGAKVLFVAVIGR